MERVFPTEEKVSKARALVMGAGILGSRVVVELLSAGFKHIVVADRASVSPDDVDGAFFTDDDVGLRGRAEKVVACIEPRPDLHILALRKDASSMDGWAYDVIFSCSESYEERLRINSKAKTYGIPLIDGMVSGGSGRLQVVRDKGPCLQCSLSLRSSAPLMPTSPVVADKLAKVMAEEGLVAIGPVPANCLQGVLYINIDGISVLTLGLAPGCPYHKQERRR